MNHVSYTMNVHFLATSDNSISGYQTVRYRPWPICKNLHEDTMVIVKCIEIIGLALLLIAEVWSLISWLRDGTIYM